MEAHEISLPEQWPFHVRRATIHVVSLARTAIIHAWSNVDDIEIRTVKIKSQLERLKTENAQLRDQLAIICFIY